MALTTRPAGRASLHDRAAVVSVHILDQLLNGQTNNVAIRLWDGTVLPSALPPRFTLVLNHPGALRRMLVPPTDLAMGEAFVRADFDIEGDLEAAIDLVAEAAARLSGREWLSLGARALALPGTTSPRAVPSRVRLRGLPHTLSRDRAAARHHYDVGNDFFALWLDSRMVYSCAYFATGTETLDAAQEAKLDLVCRKIRLHPGERVLDIGCGWGGLIIHAVKQYGVQAVGITLSEPQAQWARRKIAEAGLQDRCRVDVCDYREVADGPFDKIVSVGMVEHVGRRRLPEYFARARAMLRPGGLFLNHGMAGRPISPPWRRLGRWTSFIQAHVFPDVDALPLGESLAMAEAAGFEVRDIEGLREHYVRTSRLWLKRLEACRDIAVALVGEGKYRTWLLLTAGVAHEFARGRTSVFQTLLAKPDARGTVELPWSRANLYA
jgi:cyclopropane-fatty-acyl-phospholipid synthase